MEKLSMKTTRGRARLAGTIFCITGALIFTFWKGQLLGAIVTSPMIQLHFESPEKTDAWLKGSALILTSYFACSVSLVLQVYIYIYIYWYCVNGVPCVVAPLLLRYVKLLIMSFLRHPSVRSTQPNSPWTPWCASSEHCNLLHFPSSSKGRPRHGEWIGACSSWPSYIAYVDHISFLIIPIHQFSCYRT